ncbi:MAG: DM13 domain-containing protein [Leptolyngbyaceae cyanobacterium SL_7_1]|nr:DM13 domain-containing protein [Leptolyngbyaceae cyanobacterium SL_7_1]
MKVSQFFVLSAALIVSVSCTRETTVTPPVSEAVSPTPSTAVTAAAPAETTAAATDQPIKTGTFVAGEAPTAGTARVVSENGENYLELDSAFSTSDQGPDLYVILHRLDDVLGSTEPPAYPLQEGDYVILAPLQEFTGAQRYLIPADVNLDDYKSAVIWCRQFNATFGVATFGS